MATVSTATTSVLMSAVTVFQTVTVTPTTTVYYSHLDWCTNIAPHNIFDRTVAVGAAAAAIGLLLSVWDWWRMRGVVGRSEALEVEYKFYTSMFPGAEHKDHVLVSNKLYEMLELA
ncbi:hypothetical protein TWF506_003576 [Arthrobotrys conoides]|uniref:Uncharacterized protein n=1 Tax=Arthrobotrys conoides TaxID=74498 RepID=A0AAN8N446_9PEZI